MSNQTVVPPGCQCRASLGVPISASSPASVSVGGYKERYILHCRNVSGLPVHSRRVSYFALQLGGSNNLGLLDVVIDNRNYQPDRHPIQPFIVDPYTTYETFNVQDVDAGVWNDDSASLPIPTRPCSSLQCSCHWTVSD